jgi:hypothetical protein
VYTLIKPFLSLCLLNSTPQDLPSSEMLLGLTLFFYLLVSVILALPFYGVSLSLMQAVLEVGILIIYTRIVLQLSAHLERYMQTLSALAGTGVIVGVMATPLAYSSQQSTGGAMSNSDMTLLAYLLITVWLLVVYGHVFRHALSSGMFVGIIVSLGYILVSSIIIDMVLPPPSFG